MRLSRNYLDRLRADPVWRARAKEVRRQLACYSGEQHDVFVPDVPITATEPITGNLWYHGLGPVGYANILRRFKAVLEPLTHEMVERWRGKPWGEVVDEIYEYGEALRPKLDQCDQQDRVRARHLQLWNIFRGFYCSEPIDLIGAGPLGLEVYGFVSNGLHRLFIAQTLGTIDTLPARVSFRIQGPSHDPIDKEELYLDDEQPPSSDAQVINVHPSPWGPATVLKPRRKRKR
jgi:hypothetical protein